MPVPETPVHKDHGAAFRKHDIRLSGQIKTVDPKTISELVKERANLPFRRCVG
jgi:hypothetical protein